VKYTITQNYGMLPNQIEGVTDDGQHFYFRGRSGKWQLHFGSTSDEAITGPGYEGEEEKAGWFEKEEWEAFFWVILHTVEEGKAKRLDLERHKREMEELLVRLTTPATTQQIAEFHKAIKGEK
jgi:hypothetical protein